MLPTNTDVTVDVKTKIPGNCDALVVFLAEGGKICGDAPELLGAEQMQSVERLIKADAARGKAREVAFDLVECGKDEYRRVYVAGVGSADKLDAEKIRQAAGAVARAVRKHRIKNVAVVPPVMRQKGVSGTEAAATGFLLASYDFTEYRGTGRKKSDAEDDRAQHVNLSILSTESAAKDLRAKVDRARMICEAQNFARTIANRPGNEINPPKLAEVARQMCKEVGLSCRVLDEKEMKRLGMGGILAVGAGSNATPPRMIVMEYKPKVSGVKAQRSGTTKKAQNGRAPGKPLLVVGKAITFDSGGISIKPAEKMGRMVYDKCGAMAVLGLMIAVARLKPPIPVVGILSSAENLLSETSYRPGDILRMYNGVTVEVTNTDAEGRLVLGDALAWGVETYKPAAVVDLATLTGGCVVALGQTQAGLMGNDDEFIEEIKRVAARSGEKVWHLPVGDVALDLVALVVADIVNSAGRWGSALTAGAFLSYFVPRDGSVPWAHLDIAGVADTEKELPYIGKGATGWGVRTLVEWVESRASNSRG
jgi:leucyl aminopeptidase